MAFTIHVIILRAFDFHQQHLNIVEIHGLKKFETISFTSLMVFGSLTRHFRFIEIFLQTSVITFETVLR